MFEHTLFRKRRETIKKTDKDSRKKFPTRIMRPKMTAKDVSAVFLENCELADNLDNSGPNNKSGQGGSARSKDYVAQLYAAVINLDGEHNGEAYQHLIKRLAPALQRVMLKAIEKSLPRVNVYP